MATLSLRPYRLYAVLAALLTLLAAGASHAQSVLFITNGDASSLQAINVTTGTIQYSVTSAASDYAIAVRNTIWLRPYNGALTSQEYALNNGQSTGLTATINSTGVGEQWLDGAADGTFNYTLGWTGSAAVNIYRAARDWSNASLLFNTSSLGLGPDMMGITFDTASGNLWLSNNQTIYQVTTGGVLVSQFSHTGSRGSLAYQGSTNTLWYVPNNSSSPLLQYSKTGTLLQSLTVTGRSGNVWGAEFQVIPEPPIYALFSLGLGALAWLNRRRWR